MGFWQGNKEYACHRGSRALGPVAVRGPVRVAPAAGLLVAGRPRRHAAAHAAALEARPAAHVLARVGAAPDVARAATVCILFATSDRTNHSLHMIDL
jgi:hypothetical protein